MPPDFAAARSYALDRLARELAPWLVYHSLNHTLDLVLPAAENLAALEGLSAHDTGLAVTAAAFHDLGFIYRAPGHEDDGARLAREVLPMLGFSLHDIQQIEQMILSTRLPQSPRTVMDQIVADSDLSVLGAADFLTYNQALRDELASLGRTFSDEEWYASQLRFVQGHRYFTTSARAWLDEQKAKNILVLTDLLAKSQGAASAPGKLNKE